MNGDVGKGGVLSYLPGQKLSRCTCAEDDHPGPKHPDGSWVGRAAPEIDVFEAQVTVGAPNNPNKLLVGQVSQSAQWAVSDASAVPDGDETAHTRSPRNGHSRSTTSTPG